MTAHMVLGDTRAVVESLPDGCVDAIITSPPFLALRSYLPADHPDKAHEIGQEPNPGAFIDVMLDLTEQWARVLAPHGSIAVEFGDTYSGSGGAGGDYADGGMRAAQPKFRQGTPRWDGRPEGQTRTTDSDPTNLRNPGGPGWPMAKSLCLIPELYRVALAYGLNPLTGRTTDPWRVRNVVRWVRPNPPVGALGDKFRPATSDMVIACKSAKRWFDLDAVRTTPTQDPSTYTGNGYTKGNPSGDGENPAMPGNPAGSPPLDWWKISPGGFSGKVETKRRGRVEGPRAGAYGVERTTSADCPVHADLPGQLPKALRDERAVGRSRRTPRSGDRPERGPVGGSSPTDLTTGPTGSSPSPTSVTLPPPCVPSATPRSTASRRTDPAPATNPAGSASGRTTRRTSGTSGSHLSGEPHPGTPESSISSDGSPVLPSRQTTRGTADTATGLPASSGPCTCSFWEVVTESTSHYAVFPHELVERPVEAMVPRRVCRTCGEPSRREVDVQGLRGCDFLAVDGAENDRDVGHQGKRPPMPAINRTTTGWTSCGCPGTAGIRLDGYHDGTGWRPGIVLDPFGGTGTVAIVATGRSRDALLIDLDERNADLARERLGMFLTVSRHGEALPDFLTAKERAA